ncbi:MAG: hypothetical protein V2A74_00655 [bacterium]
MSEATPPKTDQPSEKDRQVAEKAAKKVRSAPKVGRKPVSSSQHAVLELRHLRSLLKEIAQHYLAAREGELEQIIEQVQSNELDEGEREKLADFVLHEIERIDLKPRKGRLKDIRRLDRCLKVLNQKLNERL